MEDESSGAESFKKLIASCKSYALECRVCEDVYSLQGEKVPRLLYCGHTICHSCLLKLPLRDDTIQCPFDRQSTPIGNSGVWGLKKNFALLELLERLQSSSKNTIAKVCSYMKTAQKDTCELTLPCDENENHTAVVYCTVCGSNLCLECSELTHATKTLAKHRRVPVSEKPKEKSKCSIHPSHIAEFVCLENDCQSSLTPNTLMCFICKDYGRHKNHKHALIDVEAETIRSSISTALSRHRVFMESLNETLIKLEHVIQRIEGGEGQPGTGALAKAWVKVHFDEIREDLKVQEQVATTTVETHVRERLCALRQTQEDLTLALSQVATVCVECEQAIRQDDARVVMSSKELEEAIASLENTKARYSELGSDYLQPDPSFPITFTKDNRVHIGPTIEIRVVTLGLDGAGKTSILFKLKQNEFMTMIPTIGFNVETIEYKNIKFTIWDVGGQPKLRPLWKHYYFNTQAVIFVIDSCSTDRLNEAHAELVKLLSEKELKNAAFLILANKQDVSNCMTIETITEGLQLQKLCNGRSWHVEACSSQSGQGVKNEKDYCKQIAGGTGELDKRLENLFTVEENISR